MSFSYVVVMSSMLMVDFFSFSCGYALPFSPVCTLCGFALLGSLYVIIRLGVMINHITSMLSTLLWYLVGPTQ